MVPNFTSSIFSNPQLLPTSSEIYSAFVALHLIRAAFTQSPTRDCNVCIHTLAFYLSSNHASTFKPLHPPWHSVAPALRHTHAAALKRSAPRRRYTKEAEGPTRCSHCEGQHSDLRQLLWLMHHCVHAEGCSSTSCMGITFCEAQRSGQSCFNSGSEFSPFAKTEFFPSSLFPHVRKNLACPWEKQYWGKNSVTGAGQGSARAGLEGRAGMGAGPGRAWGVSVPT